MSKRTFAIGDIHGEYRSLQRVLRQFPTLTEEDTLVFLGDYIDRGADSRPVVEFLRELPSRTNAKVVTLRGNHEDSWLRVIDRGWPEFVVPVTNGCLAAMRSFLGQPLGDVLQGPSDAELKGLLSGSFFPKDVVQWMRELPYFYEDEHAIYVHAGLPKLGNRFPHPSEIQDPIKLLWCRDEEFFRNYSGKLIVFGHTSTRLLPPELSSYTPNDPLDMWAGPCVVGLDTGSGKGGFLTALELPARRVYESRDPVRPRG